MPFFYLLSTRLAVTVLLLFLHLLLVVFIKGLVFVPFLFQLAAPVAKTTGQKKAYPGYNDTGQCYTLIHITARFHAVSLSPVIGQDFIILRQGAFQAIYGIFKAVLVYLYLFLRCVLYTLRKGFYALYFLIHQFNRKLRVHFRCGTLSAWAVSSLFRGGNLLFLI